MKYNVIQNSDGNTSIVSEWSDVNKAKQAFHNQCRLLYADDNVVKAIVGLFDEQLNIVDEKKEYIDKTPILPLMFEVSFNSHGGSAIEDQTVEYGQRATEPEPPTRDGYSFSGWELNGYPYDFSFPVTSNIVLVAQWTEIPTPEPVEE